MIADLVMRLREQADYEETEGSITCTKILREAADAIEAQGWRPIAEAPKDKAVLLAKDDHVCLAWWDEKFELTCGDDTDAIIVWRGAWTTGIAVNWGFEEAEEVTEPTHWMPLPAPPPKQGDE